MKKVSWVSCLQFWNSQIVPHYLLILEDFSKFGQKLLNRLYLPHTFFLQAKDFASVHQFLLLSQLFHNELILFQVLEVALPNSQNLLEDLALLSWVGLGIDCIYLLDDASFLVVLEGIFDNPPIQFGTGGGVGIVSKHPHHGDVQEKPVIHVSGFAFTHPELLGVVRVVLYNGGSVQIDSSDAIANILKVDQRSCKGSTSNIKRILNSLTQYLQVFRHNYNLNIISPAETTIFSPIHT